MTRPSPVVFLLDVDNTLLDNDRIIVDLKRHLTRAFGTETQRFGAERADRYWAIFEKRRAEFGYADYLGTLQRYRAENPRDPHFLQVSLFLVDYPFADRLFAESLQVIERLRTWGLTVILSDGDVIFQPRKIKRSGLFDAVEGRVLVYIHKERELEDVAKRYPARHYVMVDDKLRILAEVKRVWGPRVTTVFPRQGHYAHDSDALTEYPPADVTVECIGDLLGFELPALLHAGQAGGATAASEFPVGRKTMSAMSRSSKANRPMEVLVVDVGGSHVKISATGQEASREFPSGPTLTAEQMVAGVLKCAAGWKYDAVSLGYPGPVLRGRPVSEPHNLASGWVGFDFEAAFGHPVKIINDAAMQALGSYTGGRMLFLGLGTGLGSAMIVDGVVEPMELGHLPYRKGTYEDYVGKRRLERVGKRKWRRAVEDVVARLITALEPDDVVLGGGNVRKLKKLPPGCRAGENANAFRGGFRLWEIAQEPRRPPHESHKPRSDSRNRRARHA